MEADMTDLVVMYAEDVTPVLVQSLQDLFIPPSPERRSRSFIRFLGAESERELTASISHLYNLVQYGRRYERGYLLSNPRPILSPNPPHNSNLPGETPQPPPFCYVGHFGSPIDPNNNYCLTPPDHPGLQQSEMSSNNGAGSAPGASMSNPPAVRYGLPPPGLRPNNHYPSAPPVPVQFPHQMPVPPVPVLQDYQTRGTARVLNDEMLRVHNGPRGEGNYSVEGQSLRMAARSTFYTHRQTRHDTPFYHPQPHPRALQSAPPLPNNRPSSNRPSSNRPSNQPPPAFAGVARPVLILDNLAIGRLQRATKGYSDDEELFSAGNRAAHDQALDERGCHFCVHKSDYGVSDEAVLMDREKAQGFCEHCGPNRGSFYEQWRALSTAQKLAGMRGTDDEKRAKLREINDLELKRGASLANEMNMNANANVNVNNNGEAGARTYCKIDREDITRFMGPMFCKDCPWTQVDVSKARICKECRRERLTIIAHGRHTRFLPISIVDAPDYVPPEIRFHEGYIQAPIFNGRADNTWTARQVGDKRCMICTGRAVSVCANCPLKLCGSCEVVMLREGEGWLNKLVYQYKRHHIRNDAFLLRSDGGGN